MQHRRNKAQELSLVVEKRWSRREFLQKTAFVAGALPLFGSLGCANLGLSGTAKQKEVLPSLPEPVSNAITDRLTVPKGYDSQVLLAWGDPIIEGAPPFAPGKQQVADQLGQFGTCVDFIAYVPLAEGPEGSRHGLLCCNHEFSNGSMMFPGFANRAEARNGVDENQCGVEMAALGHSIVEIRKEGREWKVVKGPLNRRISLLETEIDFSGPVAGHPRMQTRDDPAGTRVKGTLANCSGGVTPWGTVLICEENINYYFDGILRGVRDQSRALWHHETCPVSLFSVP